MISRYGLPLASLFSCFVLFVQPAYATDRTIIAEGQYLMADGDTLASAERAVLQRAQRKAIEEAGIYLGATFHDHEVFRNGQEEPHRLNGNSHPCSCHHQDRNP